MLAWCSIASLTSTRQIAKTPIGMRKISYLQAHRYRPTHFFEGHGKGSYSFEASLQSLHLASFSASRSAPQTCNVLDQTTNLQRCWSRAIPRKISQYRHKSQRIVVASHRQSRDFVRGVNMFICAYQLQVGLRLSPQIHKRRV